VRVCVGVMVGGRLGPRNMSAAFQETLCVCVCVRVSERERERERESK